MFLYVCLAASFALAASSSCNNTNTPDDETLKARFCAADIVFRGQITNGGSSRSTGPDSESISNVFDNFNVDDFLKRGTIQDRRPTIRVERQYVHGSPCHRQYRSSFPRDGSVVLFGTIVSSNPPIVRIEPCQFYPSWNCLPNSFKLHYNEVNFCS